MATQTQTQSPEEEREETNGKKKSGVYAEGTWASHYKGGHAPEDIEPVKINRVTKSATYSVKFSDERTGPADREYLMKAGFKKYSCCKGHGLVPPPEDQGLP